VDDVIQFHADAMDVSLDDARARLGVNEGKLASATERPQTYAYYQGADLALQAVMLAHGISESQAFIDGNKRTALVAMDAFLEANGYLIGAPEPERADWILRIGTGTQPEQIAEELRQVLLPIT
jgi:death on curing protein